MAGACLKLRPFNANAAFQAGAVCSAVNAKTSTQMHGQETVSAVVLFPSLTHSMLHLTLQAVLPAEWKGSKFNILSLVVLLFLLTPVAGAYMAAHTSAGSVRVWTGPCPVAGLVFAYFTYGNLWG